MPVDPNFYPDASFAVVAASPDKWIQTGTGTLVAGVLTVSSGIVVTANTRVFMQRKTEAGTDGDELRCPAADRTIGADGVGAITIRSFLNGAPATSDTSTIEWLLIA